MGPVQSKHKDINMEKDEENHTVCTPTQQVRDRDKMELGHADEWRNSLLQNHTGHIWGVTRHGPDPTPPLTFNTSEV